MSKPAVIVITQPGGRRHQLAAEHFREMGVDPCVSPAVFLTGAPEDCAHYDHRRRVRELGYGLTKGEVGCFLAHRKAWEKVAELGTTCLVVEDDARMTPELPTRLKSLASAIEGADLLLRLYSFRHPQGKVWRQLDRGLTLVRPFKAGSSAVAYMLTPQAAQRLLGGSGRFWLAVDEYMDDEAAHGCAILDARPELIRHDDDGSSLIGARTKPSIGPWAKLRRESLRLIRNLRQSFWRERVLWRLGIRFGKTTR